MATTSTDTNVSQLVINKMTKAEYEALQTKSDTELYLIPESVDSSPTQNSTNPVQSGGVYTALSGKANTSDLATVATSGSYNDLSNTPTIPDITGKEDKITLESASGATLSAQVGKYYTLVNVGTLEITLPTMSGSTTTLQSVTFYINANSAPAVTFVSVNQIIKSDGFIIEADCTYEVSAIWNGIGWVIAQVKLDYQPPVINIKTKSSGGQDAAITVTKDGVATDIVYTSVQSGNYWDNGIIKVMYGPQGYNQKWAIFAEATVNYNSVEYLAGDVVNNWAYNSSIDFDIYY